MFSQIEDFERCPECDNPYFKKEVSNVIRKEEVRNVNTPILVFREITEFKCTKCNYLIGKFTQDIEPKYYN